MGKEHRGYAVEYKCERLQSKAIPCTLGKCVMDGKKKAWLHEHNSSFHRYYAYYLGTYVADR